LQSPTSVEHSLIRTVGQHMLRRAIQLIRGARHGGMILFVESSSMPACLRAIRLKYRFSADEPTRRYRTLLLQMIDQMANGTLAPSVGWSDFALDTSPALESMERSIFELSRVIAGLAATDGAVVLDKRFEVIGFGAEVSAELPAPDRVFRAIDVEGHVRRANRWRAWARVIGPPTASCRIILGGWRS
jgi:hypothetical protein